MFQLEHMCSADIWCVVLFVSDASSYQSPGYSLACEMCKQSERKLSKAFYILNFDKCRGALAFRSGVVKQAHRAVTWCAILHHLTTLYSTHNADVVRLQYYQRCYYCTIMQCSETHIRVRSAVRMHCDSKVSAKCQYFVHVAHYALSDFNDACIVSGAAALISSAHIMLLLRCTIFH
jgi:hypothetical protein